MFYTNSELFNIGFKKFGDNVLISTKCSIYGAENISIGNNVRIDDFCILSAGSEIIIGDYVHIACYASLIGKGRIIIENFVGLSGRVSVYSSNDDYTGQYMTNPTIPIKYRKVLNGDVIIKAHSIIGSGSIILPNLTIGIGTSVSALTLIKEDCEEFSVYAGIPAKLIRKRLKKFLEYEKNIIGNY